MSYVEENAAARERILGLAARATEAQLAAPLDGGWTIGAELAHLAFWDRVHTARLRRALEAGEDLPARFSPEATDAINDSGLDGWRLIPGEAAIRLFADASNEVDAYLATLGPEVVERIPIRRSRSARRPIPPSRRTRRRDRGGAWRPVGARRRWTAVASGRCRAGHAVIPTSIPRTNRPDGPDPMTSGPWSISASAVHARVNDRSNHHASSRRSDFDPQRWSRP